jgi:hypothetical protein
VGAAIISTPRLTFIRGSNVRKLGRTVVLAGVMTFGFTLGAVIAFAGCALVLGVAARAGDSDVSTGVGLGTLAGGIAGLWAALVALRILRKRRDPGSR